MSGWAQTHPTSRQHDALWCGTSRSLRDAQLAGIEMLLLTAAICIRRAPWPAHGPDSALLYAEDEAGTKLGQASIEVSTAAPTG